MKIFYSWQMDAPRKINKNFIHNALLLAVGKLGDDLDIDEAERENIEVDQDTQGVLGSPDVVRVILDKIASSDVVVADVSLVGTGQAQKKHINSNVAIELGYSYGKLGDSAVIKLMNTHYGEATELPFDLRTRRHPVQYSLPPDADKDTISAEQRKLARELTHILKLYLKKGSTKQTAQHQEVSSTNFRGAYWTSDHPIVPAHRPYVRNDTYCGAASVVYTRLIPELELPDISSREAVDATAGLWPLLSEGGCSRSRNRWGAVSHCIANDGDLIGFTQIFKNREIWGVDCYYADLWTSAEDEGEESIRYLPTGAIQREYYRSIASMIDTAQKLGYGDSFTVEMGISGANGLHLAIDRRYFSKFPGPIYEDEVSFRTTFKKGQNIGELMNQFWKMLFDEVGSEVPEELIYSAQ